MTNPSLNNALELGALHEEYAAMLKPGSGAGLRFDQQETDAEVVRKLVAEAGWTPEGAAELVYLATQYGTFVLRNATALAAALKIEDGHRGL